MRYEREFLQQKGIPHLPGDWDFRSEAQQVNWISENYPNVFSVSYKTSALQPEKHVQIEKYIVHRNNEITLKTSAGYLRFF